MVKAVGVKTATKKSQPFYTNDTKTSQDRLSKRKRALVVEKNCRFLSSSKPKTEKAAFTLIAEVAIEK